MSLDIEVVNQFADKRWRMANLYWILDENNREVRFVPNVMQQTFWDAMWYWNWILKARQHGFTTFIDLYILDECVFYPNQIAGIIAHTIDDVKKIFRRKIKHPYDRLPQEIKDANPATNDSAQELVFRNGSEISVATTMRSGMLSYLHVSEFGYIAWKYPEKAEEIVTGSFETIHPGSYIWVEGTGHGTTGHFYDGCKRSRERKLAGTPLAKIDFKYHFYPWWANPKYRLPPEDAKHVVFTRQLNEYFAKLERAEGAKLDLQQRAWYAKKKEMLGDMMFREHPSNEKEPFQARIKGAIFAEQMARAREEGRVTKVPYDPALPVDTWWDIGRSDINAIWFVQTIGREYRFIWYHEDSLKWLVEYCRHLDELAREQKWRYRHHVGPHDIGATEYGGKPGYTRWKTANENGYRFLVGQQWEQGDQIDAARSLIPMCYFDEENCQVGIEHLEQFRFEWNERMQTYTDTYLHNEHSHGSSAFMTGAMMLGILQHGKPKARPVTTTRFAT